MSESASLLKPMIFVIEKDRTEWPCPAEYWPAHEPIPRGFVEVAFKPPRLVVTSNARVWNGPTPEMIQAFHDEYLRCVDKGKDWPEYGDPRRTASEVVPPTRSETQDPGYVAARRTAAERAREVGLPCVLYDRGNSVHLEITPDPLKNSMMDLDRDQCRYLSHLLLEAAGDMTEKPEAEHEAESLADA